MRKGAAKAQQRHRDLSARIDRLFGEAIDLILVLMEEEIDLPFPKVTLTVNCDTPASQQELTQVGRRPQNTAQLPSCLRRLART